MSNGIDISPWRKLAAVPTGPIRVDLHVKVLSERVVRRAKARGLDAIVYAPHFRRLPEIRSRAADFSDPELAVIPAREVFTGSWRTRKHVLALGLAAPVPDFISLKGALTELDRQDATVLVPHPTYLSFSLGAADLARHRDRIHAVETYNTKYLPYHAARARRLQGELGLPAFGSSYAHLPGTVGEVWTEFRNAAPTAAGVAGAIRAGETTAVEHRTGAGHLGRRLLELGHIGYENSVEKFDRVALSGTEATHPDQPAYEGRFDDVAVYDS